MWTTLVKHEFFLVFSLLRFGVLFSYVLPERNQRLEFEERLLCLDQKILRNFISRKGAVLAWPFRVENFPEMKLRDIAWQPRIWTVVESQFGERVLEVNRILWNDFIFCEFQLYRAEIIQGSPQTCGSSISQRKKLKYQTILSSSLWFREIWE